MFKLKYNYVISTLLLFFIAVMVHVFVVTQSQARLLHQSATATVIVPEVTVDVTRTAGTPRPRTPTPTRYPDYTPPQTTCTIMSVTSNNGWYRSAVKAVLEATDDWVGPAYINYRLDSTSVFTTGGRLTDSYLVRRFPITVSQEGINQLEYYTKDKYGNVETPHTTTLKIDLSPPTATVKLNPSGRYSRCELLHYVVGDAVSGLDSVVVAVDGRRVSHNTRGLPGEETPAATATAIPPTETAVPTATAIPPTETAVPTATTLPPTETAVPTATAIPPTETTVPTATTLPPTETAVPTATTLPPTETTVPTATATATASLPTAAPSSTVTPLPPSPTVTETGTRTPLPSPTATPSATPLPPTVTPSATMTALPTLLPPTVTPTPTPTLAPHHDSRTLSLLELAPGAHTIALTVTDKAGWVTTVVQPIEVVVDIPSLICTTELWQQVGGIYGPQATQLTNDLVGTLQQAQAVLTTAEGASFSQPSSAEPPLSRQAEVAIGFMEGYIQQVTAETGRAIRPNAAVILTGDAQAIIERLRQGQSVTGQSERQGVYLPIIEK